MPRTKNVNGVDVQLTSEEEAVRDAEEARYASEAANRAATQYARDRRPLYPDVGDQLDALWKGGDAEAAMKVIVDKVKSDNPKPE